VRELYEYLQLPECAKIARRRDRLNLPLNDPGARQVINCGLAWLCLAQDQSTSQDGGVARHFSLLNGWGPSYPETTGYIIPTILKGSEFSANKVLPLRAQRMLDWLVSIQFPEGGFRGGTVFSKPLLPVTFNTGQILLGLANGVAFFGTPYRDAMRRAADWLVHSQDHDGCWRKYPSPFTEPGEKAYDTHIAWGLFEAARMDPGRGYAEAALANVRWALTKQQKNGWIADCCLTDHTQPLTHTLGYALRGIIEAYRFSHEQIFLKAALKTADGLLSALEINGFLPGRLDSQWRARVNWVCLTGTSQIAHSFLLLYQLKGDLKYREAGFSANRFVRKTIVLDGPAEICGAVKGSFPIDSAYGKYEYLN